MMIRSVLESERKRPAVFAVLNLDLTLFYMAAEEKKDKYGVFLERSLTVAIQGDGQITLLRQFC